VRIARHGEFIAILISSDFTAAFIPWRIGIYRSIRRDGDCLNILLHPFTVAKTETIADPGSGVGKLGLSEHSAWHRALQNEHGHAQAGREFHDRFLAGCAARTVKCYARFDNHVDNPLSRVNSITAIYPRISLKKINRK
jgi:hypothetical protein